MVKRISCTSCGTVLDVPQRSGEPYRDIHCPKCNSQLRVIFGDPQLDNQAETVYGGMKGVSEQKADPEDEALTLLSSAKADSPGMLVWGREKFPLHLGRNLVGRESRSSNADIQIPTDDFQMSREHVVINIKRIADGSLKALVRNCKDKLITEVKGMKLETDDEVVLTSGTNLKLGHTMVSYIVDNRQR